MERRHDDETIQHCICAAGEKCTDRRSGYMFLTDCCQPCATFGLFSSDCMTVYLVGRQVHRPLLSTVTMTCPKDWLLH